MVEGRKGKIQIQTKKSTGITITSLARTSQTLHNAPTQLCDVPAINSVATHHRMTDN